MRSSMTSIALKEIGARFPDAGTIMQIFSKEQTANNFTIKNLRPPPIRESQNRAKEKRIKICVLIPLRQGVPEDTDFVSLFIAFAVSGNELALLELLYM